MFCRSEDGSSEIPLRLQNQQRVANFLFQSMCSFRIWGSTASLSGGECSEPQRMDEWPMCLWLGTECSGLALGDSLAGSPDQNPGETRVSGCLFSQVSSFALLMVARRIQISLFTLRAAILHPDCILEPTGPHTTRTVLGRGVAPVLLQHSLDNPNLQPRLRNSILNSRFMCKTLRT